MDADQMVSVLRQHAPNVVRVYAGSDDYRDVAVPQRRKRWTQVVATIESLAWSRCELLDKKGALLATFDNDSQATELENLSVPGGSSMQMRWMMELMIKAQSVALQFRDKEHTTLLATMREMLQLNMQSTRDLIQIMRLQRDEAMELAEIRAAAAQGGDIDQVIKMIEASPKLLQTLGPLIAMFRRPQLPRRAEGKGVGDGNGKG